MAKDRDEQIRGFTLSEAIKLPRNLFRAVVLWLFYKQEVGLQAPGEDNKSGDREAFNTLIGVQRPAEPSIVPEDPKRKKKGKKGT